MDYKNLAKLILDGKVTLRKESYARGYISRKSDGIVEEYTGRYGKGYKLHIPCYISTRYHFVYYYIFK